MDRVFLDANVIYSAAYRAASPLRRLWQLEDVELWTSDYAAAEAIGNLSEDRPDRVADLHGLLGQMHIEAQTAADAPLTEDVRLAAKDRPILHAAIRVGARFLLTGDKTHFGPHFGRTCGGVTILPPSEFFRLHRPQLS